MRIKTLKLHYITLLIFCQVFCLCFSSSTYAASNSLSIECPEELVPGQTITCSVSSNSQINISTITGTFSTENLTVKDFRGASPWTGTLSGNDISINSSEEKNGISKVGTIDITSSKPETTGTLIIDNLIFGVENQYSFSVVGPYVEIKILTAPTCTEDEELVDGVCKKRACTDDEELVDGKCQKKVIECKDDEELVDGVCKRITPVCQEDEIIVDNTCQKKPPKCKEGEILVKNVCVVDVGPKVDYLLIGIIVGSVIIIIGIILIVVFLYKKKKESSQSGSYLSLSHSRAGTTTLRSQSGVNSNFSGSRTGAPANLQQSQQSTRPNSQNSYDNGTYLSRSGEVSEATAMPPKNNDPRLQMKMETASTALQAKGQSNQQMLDENGQPIFDPNDPRLQIQFNSQQQEMRLKTTQPTTSAYQIANQAAPEETAKPNEVIQKAQIVIQPNGPIANQYPNQPSMEQYYSQPSQKVELSKPTDPDVFES